MPTQVIKDFEINDLQNGIKTMTLRSIQARMYEDEKVAEVDSPELHFYKEGRPSSRLNAPHGKIHTETHAVETWGGVTVVTVDSSTLTTERLRYNPETRKIYSEDNVRIEKPDSITEGKGLETDPEFERIKMGRQKVRFKKGIQP
jgi:LPS export ABC transporter protein LptC